MKPAFAAILSFLAITALADTRIVDLGSRKVRVRAEGSGPTVVFEAGFRSTLDSWDPVIPEVAKFARVFAYDRAGNGQSDFVDGERSYAAIVHELHDLLLHEKVATPVVFVGHSYGGALARVFYQTYPSEVNGIVFVDPLNEVFINNDPARDKNLALQESSLAGAPPGPIAEWAFLKKEAASGYRELLKYGKPNVPMALIVASIDRPDRWRRTSVDTYGSWVTERADSLLIVTPNSGHVVMRDEPGLVIAAIHTVLYPNPLAALIKASANGADAAIAVFRDEQKRYPKEQITPALLNTVGYTLLRDRRVADAIRVFALNVTTFPNNANAYDSLGEAYAANGEKEKALASYRKSVELDPKNENAKRAIEKLK